MSLFEVLNGLFLFLKRLLITTFKLFQFLIVVLLLLLYDAVEVLVFEAFELALFELLVVGEHVLLDDLLHFAAHLLMVLLQFLNIVLVDDLALLYFLFHLSAYFLVFVQLFLEACLLFPRGGHFLVELLFLALRLLLKLAELVGVDLLEIGDGVNMLLHSYIQSLSQFLTVFILDSLHFQLMFVTRLFILGDEFFDLLLMR